MTINTAANAVISLGTTTLATTQTQYEADTYVEIGEVESIGEFGDESNTVTFTSLKNSRVRKAKGSRDAGMVALVVGKDPTDVGQLALKAAQKTKFEYNMKIELADKTAAAGAKNTVFYLRVLVMTARDNVGNNDNVVRTTFNCAINSEPLEIAGS